MREIPLTRGYVALVDDEDYERTSQFKWRSVLRKRANGTIRDVCAQCHTENGNQLMHRFIIGVTNPKVQVDHHNHNGLDNQRHNLRLADDHLNQGNARKKPGSSRFKGVHWNARKEKWQAQIRAGGRRKYLGRFDSEVDAARAYDAEAIQEFGEFACVNFPRAYGQGSIQVLAL